MGSLPSSNAGPTTYETGVDYEETIITWKIKNFRQIFENDSLINSQQLNFHAGSRIGLPSEWRLYLLSRRTANDGKWTGFYCKLTDSYYRNQVFAKYSVSIINEQGDAVLNRQTPISNMCLHRRGWGYEQMIRENSDLAFLIDESLVFKINVIIYAVSAQTQCLTMAQELEDEDSDEDEDKPPSKKLKSDDPEE